jgi:putative methyltransferase (TIGR04325 family)
MLKRRIPESTQATVTRWLPPVMLALLKRTLGSVHYGGDYPSWQAATAECEGFDAREILERVTRAALAVKNGEAAYERDSVTFDKKAYVWHVLASLLRAAARNGGELSVLDFGGSLGSSYFQHRAWLEDLRRFQWTIVEQPSFVEVGRKHFADATLGFFEDLPSALAHARPNVLLVSAVLQYLEDPYARLAELTSAGFDTLIFDRVGFTLEGRDRLTVQRVGERIYPASYPCWFFDHARFLAAFADRYRLVNTFEPVDRANIPARYESFLFERVTAR